MEQCVVVRHVPSTYCIKHLQSFLETFLQTSFSRFLSDSIHNSIECSLTFLKNNGIQVEMCWLMINHVIKKKHN